MMYRVLVADDEPIERMIVGRTIKKYFSGQLEVVEAVNGREAAKFFTEKDCKIALLDIEMLGVNGLEAAEQIREEDRDCSIIFLTAFDEFSYAKRAISVHALDYLLKPGTEEELVAVLEEAIRLLEEKADGSQKRGSFFRQAAQRPWMGAAARRTGPVSAGRCARLHGPADGVVCPGNDDLSALRSLKKGASCCTERSPFHFPSEYGSCPETVSTSASSSSER